MKKLLALCLALALIFACSGCAANLTDENVSIESVTTLTESSDSSDSDNSTDLTDSDDSPDATNSNDSTSSENSLSSTKSDISSESDSLNESDNSNDSSEADGSGDSADSTTNNADSKLCLHSYKKATCEAPETCTKCGKTSGEALGHTYSDATCEAPKTCSVCGNTSGEALGHTYSDATCEAPKTCSVCGKTSGEALGHTYSDATCEAPETCTKCGKTKGEALGHTYSDATCDAPKTCAVCGNTSGEALGHTYSDATCEAPKTCSVCGKTSGEALGHTYSDATCEAPKTCSVCGKTSGEALGHTYLDATCDAPKTCAVCGNTSGEALGHTYSDATCEVPKTCSVCGNTTGSALGHNYVTGECVRVVNGKECGHYSEAYCPKLYLTGDMSKITDPAQTSKKIECNIDYEYRSSDDNFNGAATIKIQGTSSTQYAKKNYTINFYEDSSYSSKMKIDVGFGAQSKYCLKANWIDKTHSRNVVTAKLAGEMQAKYGLLESAPNNGAVDGFPVEVYINGEFHGLYTMNIPKDEWQFNMDKDNPNHIVICGDNWNDPVKFKAIPTDLNDWTVEVGPEDDATLQKVQRLVDFVMNSSDEEFKQNFDQYFNLDSTLNYYVMMNTAYLTDNYGKNMLLATYDGNVWYPSLYDLDSSWGTHWTGTKLHNYENSLMSVQSDSTLWARFEDLFSKEIAERYFELREDVLSEEHIMETFNSFYDTIPAEVLARETEKWNTEETPIPGYDFTQIQAYLDSVLPRLDDKYQAWK